jgi:hypothetical protein
MNQPPMALILMFGIVACLVGVYILLPAVTRILGIFHNWLS